MRGKVLRDTSRGDGLLVAQGKQFSFTLEQHWRGDAAPAVNQSVDLDLDAAGELQTVRPVDLSRLAGEHSQNILAMVQLHARRWLAGAGKQSDRKAIIASVLMLLATTFFSVLSVRVMGAHTVDASFYDVLRVINGNDPQMVLAGRGPGAGVFALLWAAAVFGPLWPALRAERFAPLAFFLPLVLWLAAAGGIFLAVRRAMSAANQLSSFMGNSRAARNMAQDMVMGMWDNTTLGVGFYLSLAVTAYFTVRGVLALRQLRRVSPPAIA